MRILADLCQRTGETAGEHACPCGPCSYVRTIEANAARVRRAPRVLLLSLVAAMLMAGPTPTE